MPRFEPFAGLRYDLDRVDLGDVIAPPYDVIDDDDRKALEARSPFNAVRVELSREEGGLDRYQAAAAHLTRWRDEGVLVADAEPSFYVSQMRFTDESGERRQTTGVLGALQLEAIGDGGILPHERTMPKPKGDRLHLLQATRTNLSPIWGLTASPLSELLDPGRDPDAEAVDELGVAHAVWRLTDPDRLEAIAAAVAAHPVLVADGHHRLETALAYREEQRTAHGGAAGGHDFILTYMVELADDQLAVRPIHRLLTALPDGLDLREALSTHFDLERTGPVDAGIAGRMAEAGALCLVQPDGTWLLRPRPGTVSAAEHDLDSSRLDVALAAIPAEVTYQHGWDLVLRAVQRGDAEAGVLLRPATVAQIAEIGRGGERMPPKTTFFYPKPRTGLVFRTLD